MISTCTCVEFQFILKAVTAKQGSSRPLVFHRSPNSVEKFDYRGPLPAYGDLPNAAVRGFPDLSCLVQSVARTTWQPTHCNLACLPNRQQLVPQSPISPPSEHHLSSSLNINLNISTGIITSSVAAKAPASARPLSLLHDTEYLRLRKSERRFAACAHLRSPPAHIVGRRRLGAISSTHRHREPDCKASWQKSCPISACSRRTQPLPDVENLEDPRLGFCFCSSRATSCWWVPKS
jgi:hypothetical protein